MPSSPPPRELRRFYAAEAAFTLAGAVEDFDTVRLGTVRANFAAAFDLPTASVEAEVAPASVLLTVVLLTGASEGRATAIADDLTLRITTAATDEAAATSLHALLDNAPFEGPSSVAATIVVTQVERLVDVPSSPLFSADDDNVSDGAKGAVYAGSAVAGVLLLLGGYFVCKHARASALARRSTRTSAKASARTSAVGGRVGGPRASKRFEIGVVSCQADAISAGSASADPFDADISYGDAALQEEDTEASSASSALSPERPGSSSSSAHRSRSSVGGRLSKALSRGAAGYEVEGLMGAEESGSMNVSASDDAPPRLSHGIALDALDAMQTPRGPGEGCVVPRPRRQSIFNRIAAAKEQKRAVGARRMSQPPAPPPPVMVGFGSTPAGRLVTDTRTLPPAGGRRGSVAREGDAGRRGSLNSDLRI